MRRGNITRLGMAVVMAIVVALWVAVPGFASSPSSGSVGPSKSSTSWSGQNYTAGATASVAACGGGVSLCDKFTLSVAATASYWDTHTGSASVRISWGDSADNFDLYVYKGGGLVDSSTSGSSTSESVAFSSPSGAYTVYVVPTLVTASGYSGSASFASQEEPDPEPEPSPTPSPNPVPSPPLPDPTLPPGGDGGGDGGGNGDGGGPTPPPGIAPGGDPSVPPGGGPGDTGTSPQGGPEPIQGPVEEGAGQEGSPHDFGRVGGEVFQYDGPLFFQPQFTVAPSGSGSGSGTVNGGGNGQPAGGNGQPGNSPDGGTGSGSGNSAETGGAGGTGSGQPAPEQPGGTIEVAPISTSPEPLTNLVWILLPIGLIFIAAVGAVVLESDEERPDGTASAPTGTASTAPSLRGHAVGVPPPGPLVMIGFATRRVIGWIGRRFR